MPVHVVEEIRGDDITSTRPWDGDHPPISIYADSVFIRRDDGILCKKRTQLVDYTPLTAMASVVPNLANWVLDLILVMDNVDPVQSVLTFSGR